MRNDDFRGGGKPPMEHRAGPRTGGARSVPPARRADNPGGERAPYRGNGYQGGAKPGPAPHRPGDAGRAETMPQRPGRGGSARPAPFKPAPARPATPPRPVVVEKPVYVPVTPLLEEGMDDSNMLVGRNPIREALRAGKPVEKLIVAAGDLSGAAMDIIRMAREAGVVVQTVDRSRLDQIYSSHQGMVAYVAQAEYVEVEDMLAAAAEKGEEPFLIVLDGITDPHNLGAIIRSAECAGAHGVIIPERRSAGLTPACAKAAAGALSHMPVARVKNLNRTLEELQAAGVWTVAAALNGEDALTADLTGPIALVIGSEGEGISALTLQKCDRRITLPMYGHIDSLNASVAAGILCYQVVQARASRK